MAVADVAELAVRLSLDDKLSPAIKGLDGKLRNLGGTAKQALGVGVKAAAAVGAVGIVALTAGIKNGIEALKADAVVAAQTEAVIKSTGGAAGVTAAQIGELADRLSILNGVQDDVVQSTSNVLLTFKELKGPVVADATQAVLDMSAALGQDTTSAAIQLGKALNDPIRGLTALRRVGVSFTAEQEEQIKSLVKSNRLYDAQAIILRELQSEFGGVAKAQADADPGRRLALSMERFQKALARGLLPVVEKIQTRLSEFLIKPSTIAAVERIGNTIAGLFTDENLDLVANAIETAANAVSGAISLFNQLPPEIKALAIGAFAVNKVTGGAVSGAASAFGKLLGAGLKQIFAANVTVIGQNVVGAGGGVPGAAPVGAGGVASGAARAAGAVAGLAIATTIQDAISEQLQNVGAPQAGGDFAKNFFFPIFPAIDAVQKLPGQLDELINGQKAYGKIDAATQAQVRDRLTEFQASNAARLEKEGAAVAAVGAKIDTSNARLGAIQAKRTSFSVTPIVNVSTSVSVRNVNSTNRTSNRYSSRVLLQAS